MRGSFQEITDIFKEYALKHDDAEFSKALDDPRLGSASAVELEGQGVAAHPGEARLEGVGPRLEARERIFVPGPRLGVQIHGIQIHRRLLFV